ncbi:MAG: hypothetical protein ACHQAY_16310 [Hyphomicrobiales bacterium]
MSLLGKAVVAIWNDILPEGRADFIEWHNREHMPERVAIPGFRRGRRYVAAYGSPQYYTLYEADDDRVLTGADYLERLNNPTPWTRQATQAFRNTSRGICRVAFSQGCGEGGSILTLRFDSEPGREAALERDLTDRMLPPLLRVEGVCGVHLCIADRSASDVETAERKGRKVGIPAWIVMVEASDPAAADKACDMLVAGGLETAGAAEGFERGLYALQFCRGKA